MSARLWSVLTQHMSAHHELWWLVSATGFHTAGELTVDLGMFLGACGLYGISTLCSQVLSAAALTLRTKYLLVLQLQYRMPWHVEIQDIV